MPEDYRSAGVDIGAGEDAVRRIAPHVRSTYRPEVIGDIGGFGGLFDIGRSGYRDPLLVSTTDGVGTKAEIARQTGRFDTIGRDLVAMCVDDLVCVGAAPLFFLDYLATGKLDVDQGKAIVEGIADGCRLAGCALIGGETAEMPGMYHGNDYDLAGFAVGAAERDGLLPRKNIAAGDVLVAMASSGVHSNGYSLVRKIVELSGLAWDAPAPFIADKTLAEALLEPTRIYVKPLLSALRDGIGIKALAHITGGGFIDNIPRVLPDALAADIDLGAVTLPPVFGWLSQVGGISEREMLRTFNCGVGMLVAVAADDADRLVESLTASGEIAAIVGQLTERSGEPVTFRGKLAL